MLARVGALACIASLVVACASANPEFDPPRKNDTDALPSDDDGGTTASVPDDDGDTTIPDPDLGAGAFCNGEPDQLVGFRIFQEGMAVQRCGSVTERDCTLTRNEIESRWELTECCLGDDLCPDPAPTYVLEFGPTGPDVSLGTLPVSLRFSFTAGEEGCKIEWVQIDDRSADIAAGVPRLLYLAAANLGANEFVVVQASPGDPVPDQVCACAEADASCCPNGLGWHALTLSHDVGTIDLGPETPTHVFPLDSSEHALEMNVVRAWQPPVCDAPPQDQWVARRLWL